MRDHDDYVTNGSWHRCECGKRYSDSDGGPCHERCLCGAMYAVEDGPCHYKCAAVDCSGLVTQNGLYCHDCEEAIAEDRLDSPVLTTTPAGAIL